MDFKLVFLDWPEGLRRKPQIRSRPTAVSGTQYQAFYFDRCPVKQGRRKVFSRRSYELSVVADAAQAVIRPFTSGY